MKYKSPSSFMLATCLQSGSTPWFPSPPLWLTLHLSVCRKREREAKTNSLLITRQLICVKHLRVGIRHVFMFSHVTSISSRGCHFPFFHEVWCVCRPFDGCPRSRPVIFVARFSNLLYLQSPSQYVDLPLSFPT